MRINETLTNNPVLEKLTAVMLVLNFLMIAFGIYHNKVLKEYRKQYLLSKQNVNELYTNMKRAFLGSRKHAVIIRAYRRKL